MLPVQLPAIYALLARTDVLIVFLQIHQRDFVYLLSQRLLLRGLDCLKISFGLVHEGLRAFVVGGEGTEHHWQTIKLLLLIIIISPKWAESKSSVSTAASYRLLTLQLTIIMKTKGQALEPRSDLSDPLRNNSFKSIKTEQYQSKIYELSNQVRFLREKLIEMENEKHSEIPQQVPLQRSVELEKYVSVLREDNDALRKQNLLLRDKVKMLESIISKRKPAHNNQNKDNVELASVRSLRSLQNNHRAKTSQLEPNLITNKNSVHLTSATTLTTNLMRELLAQCNEPYQFSGFKSERQNQKDQFYEFKNTEDCFEPFFSSLSKELKLRLKRCLIKNKDLLLVDNNIQLGVISPYKVTLQDPPQFTRIIIVITNIGLTPISNVTLEYIYNNDITLSAKSNQASTKYRTIFPNQIGSNEQIKQQLDVTVNSIDFKCVKVTLTYESNKQKYKYLLIMPLSKSKLFRELPFTSPPINSHRVQRVFQYQHKIINQITKIKSLFAHVYESKQKNGTPRYSWKVQFMGRPFWIEMHQVQQKLALNVTYESERALGEKILQELVFLLKKI